MISVQDEEISMLSEVTRLEAVMGELAEQGKDPYVLPQSSEQVILDVKGQDLKWQYQVKKRKETLKIWGLLEH